MLSFNFIHVNYYLTKSRQKSRMQKFFVIMMIFVISLLVYANGIAFNLFSAPMFANDIIAYVALAVAVTFAAIVLTTIFKDIRHGVSSQTLKFPYQSLLHENINEIELSPEALQTIKNQEIEMEESEQKKQQFKTNN